MDFNQILLEKLRIIFKKYNFIISEQWNNFIRLESGNLTFIFVHNQKENSNTFFISTNGKNGLEIDNETLKHFFKSQLKFTDVPIDIFVDNLVLFFENEGNPLINKDLILINNLEKFSSKRSDIYTSELLNKR